ncbi:TetR/AcrR family transcriptional regulator [Hymenobacter sp. BT770]|uniref:TetR/AcrR family transcriptional regulator n=1 Tax=Hymenobacter sp. BT770 TaxID=2886942 RepID=UPI001D113535|nr:TetR/AcrR family transcriptional regulator [Hymenobacter sp. BT770]MCC3155346.1 TetR/AcrR family transcriptional regulator [Hymenobacter sp. BT770]MDO3417379.1 TetR/AcrR family transcriptional regulator [Hymenobacter sp. BT770]
MKKPASDALDTSTEERIKEAARKVFLQKGYAATRVKDIAQEAGLNIALLNYYFRSKEKLFDLVMLEKLQQFAGELQRIMLAEATSLREKVELIAAFYVDLLLAQPELPVFIFSELKANPAKLAGIMGAQKVLLHSRFAQQLREELGARHSSTNPLHLLMSLLGMAVFPFVARPVLQLAAEQDDAGFTALMQERKRLLPQWFETLLQSA